MERVRTDSLKSTRVSTEYSFYECAQISPEYFTKVLLSITEYTTEMCLF